MWQSLDDLDLQRELNSEEIAIIISVFPNSVITGSGFKLPNLLDSSNKPCLEVSIKSNEFIYIDYLNNCGNINGTTLLKNMNILAQRLPNIQFILLDDASKIFMCEKEISLATIKILTKGISWYNSYGFFSDNYHDEVVHNKEKINMPYSNFKDEVYRLYIEQFKKNNSLEKLRNLQMAREKLRDRETDIQLKRERTEICIKFQRQIADYSTFISNVENEYKIFVNTLIFPDIDVSISVKEYFSELLSKINTNKQILGCEDLEIIQQCDWLSKFISTINTSEILQYNSRLRKDVRRETLTPPIQDLIHSSLPNKEGGNIRRQYINRVATRATRKKKYKRRNKTKHYKRQIKHYIKKYRMRY